MLCVSTLPMFTYFSSAFDNGGQLFSRLYCKTAITEFTLMSSVRSVWAAEFRVPNFFLLGNFRTLRNEGRLRANEGVLILLSHEKKANIMERGLFTMIGDCKVDPVLSLLAKRE